VLRAARAYGAPAVPGDRPITITTPYDVSRDTALRVATPLSSPWMGDVVTQLARDPLLATVAADGHAASDAARGDPPGANWQTVVSAANGNPFIRVAAVNTNGRERLLLLSERGADDAATAALIVAASRAASSAMPVRELEPRTLSDAELADLQRTAETESRRNRAAGGSDGRWLWLVALMLLGIETWLRRRPAERAS
jgi:hypothetical protein